MNKHIQQLVNRLNERLGLTDLDRVGVDLATCYGGYRLTTKHGSTGFAYNSGCEARLSCSEMKAHLRGLHDMLDWQEMKQADKQTTFGAIRDSKFESTGMKS